MSNYLHLYVHCIWATWDRQPLITPEIEPQLYAAMAAKCRELGCIPYAIGGMPDHVHLLTTFTATITLSRLIGEVKGASSHLITHVVAPGSGFKWQGSYAALSVSRGERSSVERYIQHQKRHHQHGAVHASLELPLNDM